jgi:hypothetical protein
MIKEQDLAEGIPAVIDIGKVNFPCLYPPPEGNT